MPSSTSVIINSTVGVRSMKQ